jgi:hypothetical protein
MESRLIEGKEGGHGLDPQREQSEQYQHLYKLILPHGSRSLKARAVRKYITSSMYLPSILLRFHPPPHNIPVSISGPFS